MELYVHSATHTHTHTHTHTQLNVMHRDTFTNL